MSQPNSSKKEAKAAAKRQKLKQAQRKQMLASLRRFGIATVVIVVVLALASVFGRNTDGPLGKVYDEVRSYPVACGGVLPGEATLMSFEEIPDQGLAADAVVTATVTTSCGVLEIELDPSVAPNAVNAFVFLARAGYYDGTAAHRLLKDLEVRFGDPTATGSGTPGLTFDAAKPADDFVYSRGVVALARDNLARNNGQFFIVLAEDAPLAPIFTPIGRVVSGADVLDQIAEVPVKLGVIRADEVSQPSETIYIESVTVTVGP